MPLHVKLVLDDSQLDNDDNIDYKYAICKKGDVDAWIDFGKYWVLTAAHCKTDAGSHVFVGGKAFGVREECSAELVWIDSEYKNGI